MTTPPDSGSLFLSPSPTPFPCSPSEEVNHLRAQAQMSTQVDPVIEAFLSANEIAFFDTFSRRIELIKSRSQALRDCHVTVFDKVLLELTQNGNNLNHPAAVNYFCEEVLGFPSNALHQTAALSNAILTPFALKQAISASQSKEETLSTRGGSTPSPDKRRLSTKRPEEEHSDVLFNLAANIDGATPRLWGVYEKAKKDFHDIADPTCVEKQFAAKFLRDTAENALQHLENKSPDQRLVDELKMTLSLAKHTAMTLSGGRKRKFDDLTGSRRISREGSSREWIPEEADHSLSTHERRPRSSMEEVRRLSSFAQPRESPLHTQTESRNGFVRNRPRFVAPELSPKDSRTSKPKKKKQAGRGPSGVPYGYSRPVDSYHPPPLSR